MPVSSVGPTFWWGGTVTDPNQHALFGQGFLEVQFYPDSIVSNCTPDGGFSVTQAPNKFSVCSPVWQLSPNFAETAAFNAELFWPVRDDHAEQQVRPDAARVRQAADRQRPWLGHS